MDEDASDNNKPEHQETPAEKPESPSTGMSSKWLLKIKTPNQEQQVEVEEDARVKTVGQALILNRRNLMGDMICSTRLFMKRFLF